MNNCPHGYTTRKACSLCVSADDDAEIASLCAQLTAETARADAAEKERDAAREFGEGMTRAATEERNRVFDDLTTAKARSAALEAMLVRWLSADTWEHHVEPMAILADDTRDLLTPAPAVESLKINKAHRYGCPLTPEEIQQLHADPYCFFERSLVGRVWWVKLLIRIGRWLRRQLRSRRL